MQEGMTKKDWLIHILNGGKGTSSTTKHTESIYFDGSSFKYSDGKCAKISAHKEPFGIYEEPKKMIKVAKYRFLYDGYYEDSARFYKDEIAFVADYCFSKITNITRLQETEIEVEDY